MIISRSAQTSSRYASASTGSAAMRYGGTLSACGLNRGPGEAAPRLDVGRATTDYRGVSAAGLGVNHGE